MDLRNYRFQTHPTKHLGLTKLLNLTNAHEPNYSRCTQFEPKSEETFYINDVTVPVCEAGFGSNWENQSVWVIHTFILNQFRWQIKLSGKISIFGEFLGDLDWRAGNLRLRDKILKGFFGILSGIASGFGTWIGCAIWSGNHLGGIESENGIDVWKVTLYFHLTDATRVFYVKF